MADDVTFQSATPATPPAGLKVAAKEATINGALKDVQGVEVLLVSGTPGAWIGVSAPGDATNGLDVDVTRLPALPAGTNNIGDVDVLTVPADPFGANADAAVAAGAAGSIQAKLRRVTQGLEDLKASIVLAAGTNNIGDVDVLTVPADPFGANADAAATAGGTGTIQAKLRRLTQGLEDLKTGIVLAGGTAAIGKLAPNDGVDIGNVDVASVTLPTGGTVTDGSTSLTTTASIQLSAGQACKEVVVQNDPDNTVDVLIGDATNQRFQLVPGQAITLPVANVSQVYAKNVSSTTQSVNWLAVN